MQKSVLDESDPFGLLEETPKKAKRSKRKKKNARTPKSAPAKVANNPFRGQDPFAFPMGEPDH